MEQTRVRKAQAAEENNPFEIVRQQIDKCAEILKLDPQVTGMLKNPMRELHVSLPVRMDDGSYQTFTQEDHMNLRVGDRVRVENGHVYPS